MLTEHVATGQYMGRSSTQAAQACSVREYPSNLVMESEGFVEFREVGSGQINLDL
jgi:hypothetical protein